MNPPDQPTPRTDAAWSKTFEDELNQFWSGNAANQMRDECATLERELTAAKAECNLHRNRLASIFWSGAIDKRTCREVQQWDDDYTAELTRLRAELAIAENWVEHHSKHADDLIGENVRLRAEVERLKEQLRIESAASAHALHWAEKAEAELADWCVLKGWGGTPEIVHNFIKGQQTRIHHCQDLEAELITERARLDYLGLHMGTRMVAEALNCDYSKCFPIRDAIDLSMKNKTTIP